MPAHWDQRPEPFSALSQIQLHRVPVGIDDVSAPAALDHLHNIVAWISLLA